MRLWVGHRGRLFCLIFVFLSACDEPAQEDWHGLFSSATGSPSIVGPGLISTDQTHDSLTAIHDPLKWIAIGRAALEGRKSSIRIFSLKPDGVWLDVTPDIFDSNEFETRLTLSPNGRYGVFLSSRLTGQPGVTDWRNLFQVSISEDGVFSTPKPVTLNTNSNECCLVFASNHRVYFSSDRGGNWDIYSADFDGNEFSNIRRLEGEINTSMSEWTNYAYPDENFILFDSIRPDGPGGDDIWISRRCGDEWTEAHRLPQPYNSSSFDDGAKVFADGLLVWNSGRTDISQNGNGDVFVAKFDPRQLIACD